MNDFEAYKDHIQHTHNAFCKIVIRHAAISKILILRRKWEREVSLDYLVNEKFAQFAEPEPDEKHPFIVCGQVVLLSNAALAAALSVLSEQAQKELFLYYFQHMTQKEIGARFGQAHSTAGRHIQLAVQRLREEMGACSHE